MLILIELNYFALPNIGNATVLTEMPYCPPIFVKKVGVGLNQQPEQKKYNQLQFSFHRGFKLQIHQIDKTLGIWLEIQFRQRYSQIKD